MFVTVSHSHPSLIFSGKVGNLFSKGLHLCRTYSCQGILTEGGRLSTVDLLIKVDCFIKKVYNSFNITNLNRLLLGGQLYWAFPLSKTSLGLPVNSCLGWRLLTITNSLAYYGTKITTDVKSFITHAPGLMTADWGSQNGNWGLDNKTFYHCN